ncbi:MAG: hypothetical protein H6839_10185 [Planctomycetes bacterium]|nr:hypothetical protein [Planctomycetota bacterium]
MRFTIAAMLLAGISGLVFSQAKSDVSTRADAAFKLTDQNGNGKIEWEEAIQTRHDYENLLALSADAEDPEAARQQVELDYEHVLELAHFLLADGNHDLVVTKPELRKFLKLVDKEKVPELELWHHEQLARLWVDESWDDLLDLMDGDADGLISFIELVKHYPTKFDPEHAQKADNNDDNKFDKSEYASFKALERLSGVLVDELENSIGVAGGASEEAGSDEDDEPEAGESKSDDARKNESRKTESAETVGQLKPGSTWQVRYDDSRSNKYEWYRVTMLDGEWAEGCQGKVEGFYYKLQHRSFENDGDADWTSSSAGGGETSASKAAYWPRDSKKTELIEVAAGEFRCLKWTRYKRDRKSGKLTTEVESVRYFMERSGVPILVKEVSPDGETLAELMKFNP